MIKTYMIASLIALLRKLPFHFGLYKDLEDGGGGQDSPIKSGKITLTYFKWAISILNSIGQIKSLASSTSQKCCFLSTF